MGFIELFLLAVGLSMDAFAVSICLGLNIKNHAVKKSFVVGLYFGIFQAVMPLLGFEAAMLFAVKIIAYDHWIAFALLCFLGSKMIIGSFKKECKEEPEITSPAAEQGIKPLPQIKETSLKPAHMLPLALATSIDALAVGISLAFLRVSIIPAVSFIGITTLVISMTGVKIGNVFGSIFKSKAELAGGVILVLIGLKILLEHLNIIRF